MFRFHVDAIFAAFCHACYAIIALRRRHTLPPRHAALPMPLAMLRHCSRLLPLSLIRCVIAAPLFFFRHYRRDVAAISMPLIRHYCRFAYA